MPQPLQGRVPPGLQPQPKNTEEAEPWRLTARLELHVCLAYGGVGDDVLNYLLARFQAQQCGQPLRIATSVHKALLEFISMSVSDFAMWPDPWLQDVGYEGLAVSRSKGLSNVDADMGTNDAEGKSSLSAVWLPLSFQPRGNPSCIVIVCRL